MTSCVYRALAQARVPVTLTLPFVAPVRCVSSAMRTSRVALRKRFGQHLLKNADVVANIVACAKLQPTDKVFEVGPGTGNLTVHLLQQAAMVYAVELDSRMAAAVTERVATLGLSDKFRCVNADVLKVNLPVFDAMVANIPYQISSPLLTRIFSHTPRPRVAIIMFQKEFAERMVAKPGTSLYCRLSVNSQLLSSSVRIVIRIDRNQFRPPPKVDSAVVEIVPRDPPADLDFEQWDNFLKLAFAGKNKTLRAVFVNKNTLAGMLRARSIPMPGAPSRKAREISLESTDASTLAEDSVKTSAGRVDKTELHQAKASISQLLARTGFSEKRANALSIPDFMTVFKAFQMEGWLFSPTTNTVGVEAEEAAVEASSPARGKENRAAEHTK